MGPMVGPAQGANDQILIASPRFSAVNRSATMPLSTANQHSSRASGAKTHPPLTIAALPNRPTKNRTARSDGRLGNTQDTTLKKAKGM